jgi:hypothetical protein
VLAAQVLQTVLLLRLAVATQYLVLLLQQAVVAAVMQPVRRQLQVVLAAAVTGPPREGTDFFPLTARLDNFHLPQPTHMMGNCRLGHSDQFGQSGDVHFLLYDNGENAHPAGIAESAK